MKLTSKILHLSLAFALLPTAKAQSAQCAPPPPAAQTCSGGIALTEGMTVGNGQTRVITASTNLNEFTLNGGTLRVCGVLSVSNLVLNKGTIIVESSGSMQINQIALNLTANSDFINRGTVFVNQDMNLGGSGLRIWNGPVSMFDVNGTVTISHSSSRVDNLGYLTTLGMNVTSNNAGAICIESDSCLQVHGDLNTSSQNVVQFDGQFQVPGTIYYSGAATVQNSFSNSNSVLVCQAPGSSAGNSVWGNSIVQPNCNSCGSLLPIELLSFRAECKNENMNWKWSTATETNNEKFQIEISPNAESWEILTEVQGAGNSSSVNTYEWSMDSAQLVNRLGSSGTFYTRLKQIDFDGAHETFQVVAAKACGLNSSALDFEIYPTVTQSQLNVEHQASILGAETWATVFNAFGQAVMQAQRVQGRVSLDVSSLPAGKYFLQIRNASGQKAKAFMKN